MWHVWQVREMHPGPCEMDVRHALMLRACKNLACTLQPTAGEYSAEIECTERTSQDNRTRAAHTPLTRQHDPCEMLSRHLFRRYGFTAFPPSSGRAATNDEGRSSAVLQRSKARTLT